MNANLDTLQDACGAAQALIRSLREREETAFPQLWSRLVDCVYSRSWEVYRVKLKLLHLNLCLAGIITDLTPGSD